MLSQDKAIEILHKNMKNENLRRHCYAVEAAMRALTQHFNEDQDMWGIAGLLHDADYELTKDDTTKHVITVISWLKDMGVDQNIINAINAHGWKFVKSCPEPKNKMEWSLYCCDELTGLIIAVSLVKDKKLENVTVESVLKKFPKKDFAKGVDRNQIKLCEEKLEIPLKEFVRITLTAMKRIHTELGV